MGRCRKDVGSSQTAFKRSKSLQLLHSIGRTPAHSPHCKNQLSGRRSVEKLRWTLATAQCISGVNNSKIRSCHDGIARRSAIYHLHTYLLTYIFIYLLTYIHTYIHTSMHAYHTIPYHTIPLHYITLHYIYT